MKYSFFYPIFIILALASNPSAAGQKTVAAKHAMIVSEQALATQVGVDILKAGGNAIDAAVAVGYALAVVNPCCGNIGGGGFMLIHLANGKNTVINFREKAPLKARPDMFLDEHGNPEASASTLGYLAVATPGTVMGLDHALKKYGSMTRKQVMAPAIRLARQGYRVGKFDARWFKFYAHAFAKEKNVAEIFLKNGKPLIEGDLLVQKDLADSLTLISEKGTDAFYKGSIAEGIVKASKDNGGILSMKDFREYRITEQNPLYCPYQGYTIISVAPPSSGGITLCEMLAILDTLPFKRAGFHSLEDVHDMVEAMRYAFYDRNTRLGDPAFVKNPLQEILSKKYISSINNKIHQTKKVRHEQGHSPLLEKTDTTHYSILDEKGNAVAVTYTLNGFFGAQIIADHTGFFLNDEMDDFSSKQGSINKFELLQSVKNKIQPGKRPLSSMTPTILMKNNQPYMILGSPGGPRIITTLLQTIVNVIDYKMDIQTAIDMPRFHYQGTPDFIELETDALPATVISGLSTLGYHFRQFDQWSAVEAILIDRKNKIIYGANDRRRPDGSAAGY